ncbi:AHH domain-containing protein [Pyxidicoccus parkwayensis]|uniref:AHH domain-containing protein n=1 Tax=Pyxidicoccus parkwayensis TaxID=2813578 RepID=A0ABX7NY19_9BACT|nr:AHH domain-containing protein [Pyxidicoccus parkwaysis]QSQ22276.1 AHH domain-containing protein [Pyxidicoccus parkwaysis]
MADEGSHILSSMPIRARLGRSADYRDNGRAELAANAGKRARVYDNDAKILEYLQHYDVSPRSRGVPKHGPAHAALYHFACFTTGQEPYSNIAHHLVPCEVFIPEEVFTEDELEIVKRVPYDVNNGKNIIFLPGFSQAVEVYLLKRGGIPGSEVWKGLSAEAQHQNKEAWKQRALRYCNVHRLPCHYDFHRDYTAQVKNDCARLKRLVRSQLGKVCASWKPPESIPRELFRLQDEFWEHVVTFGESRPLGFGANINELIKVKPSKGKLTL